MRVAHLVLPLALLACPARAVAGWEALNEAGKPFEVRSLSGATLASTGLAGKIVVIDLWATWCAPCVKELPELAALHERWRSRADVLFLSFNVTEEKSAVEAFVREKRLPFPVYLGDPFLALYDTEVFPTKLIFDFRARPARLRFRGEGSVSVASIEGRVAELLAHR